MTDEMDIIGDNDQSSQSTLFANDIISSTLADHNCMEVAEEEEDLIGESEDQQEFTPPELIAPDLSTVAVIPSPVPVNQK